MKCEVKACTRKHSGSELSDQKSDRSPECPACEKLLVQRKSHTRECKTYQDAWEDSRRTASAEEARRGIVGDPDTRPLDPSSKFKQIPQPEEVNNNLCDRQRELGGPDG